MLFAVVAAALTSLYVRPFAPTPAPAARGVDRASCTMTYIDHGYLSQSPCAQALGA